MTDPRSVDQGMSESGREFGYLGVLDPDARQAAWQQIANQIRTAIVTGEIKPGEMLPSQPRLASHYGVARETTKAALAWLRNEGLIQTRQGKGTFVRGSTLPGEYQLRTELMVLYERVGRLSGELAAVEGALASLIGRFPVREDESN